jgi:hypothetical protein
MLTLLLLALSRANADQLPTISCDGHTSSRTTCLTSEQSEFRNSQQQSFVFIFFSFLNIHI